MELIQILLMKLHFGVNKAQRKTVALFKKPKYKSGDDEERHW